MLRKLIGLGILAAVGYGIYAGLDRSGFWGTRGHDRNERMGQIEDALNR